VCGGKTSVLLYLAGITCGRFSAMAAPATVAAMACFVAAAVLPTETRRCGVWISQNSRQPLQGRRRSRAFGCPANGPIRPTRIAIDTLSTESRFTAELCSV